jgi:hypothetical protein
MGETAPMAAARLALKLVDTEDELAAARERIAELEADCVALAMGYLGISPDRNAQTANAADAEEERLQSIARKHNPYAAN